MVLSVSDVNLRTSRCYQALHAVVTTSKQYGANGVDDDMYANIEYVRRRTCLGFKEYSNTIFCIHTLGKCRPDHER